MNSMHDNRTPRQPGVFHTHGPTPTRPWQLRVGFWLFLGIAAFYLVTEHRAHLVAGLYWLPFLLLAACPLMHVFGHGAHRRHGGNDGRQISDQGTVKGDSPPAASQESNWHSHGGDQP